MHHPGLFARQFWNSKLGHAALVSIAAMTVVIAISPQIGASTSAGAFFAQPAVEAGAMTEIA